MHCFTIFHSIPFVCLYFTLPFLYFLHMPPAYRNAMHFKYSMLSQKHTHIVKHKWKIEHENVLIQNSKATSTLFVSIRLRVFSETNKNDNNVDWTIFCVNENHFKLKIKSTIHATFGIQNASDGKSVIIVFFCFSISSPSACFVLSGVTVVQRFEFWISRTPVH